VKQGLYALRARDKYLAQDDSNTLTLVSKDQRGAWPISPVDEFDSDRLWVAPSLRPRLLSWHHQYIGAC
jgi:hypothetical protein